MKAKLLWREAPRVFLLVFEIGDEVMSNLVRFAEDERLQTSRLSGIGAFSTVTFGFYDWATKNYARIEVNEPVEVVSLLGNITVFDGQPRVHAHVSLAKRDGSCFGGHFFEAQVRPTLELFVTEFPSNIARKLDPKSRLPLIAL